MRERIARAWRRFKEFPPGERFERAYHARERGRATLIKVLELLAGLALIVVGVVFLWTPGPGVLVIGFGAALIARESLLMSRALDRAERLLRPPARALAATWRRGSPLVKALIVAASALPIALTAYLTYRLFF